MRLLHYVEIENFKRFGEKQRIELDHPAVLIGPNNCGKTSAIQALALWSQAVKAWYDEGPFLESDEKSEINRLNIVAVPVQRTRFFWRDMIVAHKTESVPLRITVGIEFDGSVAPLTMAFYHRSDETVHSRFEQDADGNSELLHKAASLKIELLYPMSGLETEEPVLRPGRIDVLLGQGQTAQVLRNLCLTVFNNSAQDWRRIVDLMERFFGAKLGAPKETSRGSIELNYRQPSSKEPLDLSSSGRGFQQLLLILAYLYSHKGGVLLVDEPDAHLEILRQKQIYVLLRDVASENNSQVVIVTHSEVILEEALDNNLTLLIDGKADDLAKKTDIKNSLKHFGAQHYIKARERGYVLYVEGGTDVDMLRALAERLNHRILDVWDDRINSYYVQNNYPDQTTEAELERVEGGFGIAPEQHFKGLRNILPGLRGLAVLDNDGVNRQSRTLGDLTISYWKRYETENYFITPDVLRRYALEQYCDLELFDGYRPQIDEILATLVCERVFDNDEGEFLTWRQAPADAARLIWNAKTERLKLSTFAEEFFRRLSAELGEPMLLRKGELHRLAALVAPETIPPEVSEKLDLLHTLFVGSDQAQASAPSVGNL
jgi:energy-coupling factor transporter ATP-binding protein EcfA2